MFIYLFSFYLKIQFQLRLLLFWLISVRFIIDQNLVFLKMFIVVLVVVVVVVDDDVVDVAIGNFSAVLIDVKR